MKKKYRKKPVVIEAIQWDGTWENHFDIIDFCQGKAFVSSDLDFKRDYLYISTLEGNHLVTPNDFIIKGVKGEFYPVKPDIFELTYEQVLNGEEKEG
jgi:hypothetical protein